MKKQDNKEKLKESFSIFQKPKAEENPATEEVEARKEDKEEIVEQTEETVKPQSTKKLQDLFSGEESKGYSAVQVKRYYLEKIEDIAKEHKTTKTRVVNIIIEEFLKEHGII